MKIKSKFFIITIILTLIGLATQSIIGGGFSLLRSLIDLTVISLLLTLLLRLFRARLIPFRLHFIRSFLILASITGGLSVFLWSASFLSNTFPGALSKITISNGEKTIIYYQMSHIATEKYYNTITKELQKYAGEGHQLYIEGVLPGTEENQNRLEQSLGMKLSSGTYTDIARIMGMTSQDNTLYTGIPEAQITHADLSIDDIASHLSTGALRSENPVDISKKLSTLSDGEFSRKAVSYILRGFMNASLRYSLSGDGLLDLLDAETVEALLDKRNQTVVDTYLSENKPQAVLLYGALHFEGMYNILKSQDARWQILTLEPIYPYVP